jgi:hypothetical protein
VGVLLAELVVVEAFAEGERLYATVIPRARAITAIITRIAATRPVFIFL